MVSAPPKGAIKQKSPPVRAQSLAGDEALQADGSCEANPSYLIVITVYFTRIGDQREEGRVADASARAAYPSNLLRTPAPSRWSEMLRAYWRAATGS